MSELAQYLPLVLLVAIFWFLIIRPGRARQRDFMKTQSALAPGARVMLASGIFGELVAVADDTVELSIAPGTVVTVNRQAVARVLPSEPDDTAGADD